MVIIRENVVGSSHRVVRKAIRQPAKPRGPSTSHGGRFANCSKCETCCADGAASYLVRRFESHKLSQSPAESARVPEPHRVLFGVRRFSQTVLQAGNLYGVPTVARGPSQGRFAIAPTGVVLVRSRIPRSLPLAREAI